VWFVNVVGKGGCLPVRVVRRRGYLLMFYYYVYYSFSFTRARGGVSKTGKVPCACRKVRCPVVRRRARRRWDTGVKGTSRPAQKASGGSGEDARDSIGRGTDGLCRG
jgi:hypothetical protein